MAEGTRATVRPVQPLDYAPPRRPAANFAAVRFTAGAALVPLGLFAIGVWGGDDMACCSAIGVVFEIAITGGIFAGGQRLCRWQRRGELTERSRAATFGCGVLLGGLLLGTLFAVGRIGHLSPQAEAGLSLLTFAGAIAASPWWVFRPVGR